MTKTFRELLAETTGPKKPVAKKPKAVPAKKTAITKPGSKPAVKKVVAESANDRALRLSDLGFTSQTKKAVKQKLNEHIATIGYTVALSDKKRFDDNFDLEMSDIGFIFESEDDEEDRGDENSVDTMEEKPEGEEPAADKPKADDVPGAKQASMSNDGGKPASFGGEKDEAPAADDAEGAEAPAAGPKYKAITLTLPALMHVLKVVAHKAPDKVTLNSMVMSMANFCEDGCSIDVNDLEEIKHHMHGMEFQGGDQGADDAAVDGAEDGVSPDPSIYATDDVVDDKGGSDDGDGESEETFDDAEDETNDGEPTADGKTQVDDEDDKPEPKAEKPAAEPKADAKADADEKDEKPEPKADDADADAEGDDDEEEEVEESMDLSDAIVSVYEGVTDADIRAIRRRSGLKFWN